MVEPLAGSVTIVEISPCALPGQSIVGEEVAPSVHLEQLLATAILLVGASAGFNISFKIGNTIAVAPTPRLRKNVNVRKLKSRLLFESYFDAFV